MGGGEGENAIGGLGEPIPAVPGGNKPPPARIGVLVVHGIGEQRRFEHLDGQLRQAIGAIIHRDARQHRPTRATVEVQTGDAAAFFAEHDTWMSGTKPAVKIMVAHGQDLARKIEINFHEVWWADVNEPFSLAKQIRFWLWGLALWSIPDKMESKDWDEHGADMRPAEFPADTRVEKAGHRLRRVHAPSRIRLFLVSNLFLLAAMSLGMLVFLMKRLLNLEPINVIRVFVNYLSSIKLYNQKRRSGGGPLEDILEPPRFTIRRKMVRGIADMACADYDRWYILAHSLGSVVAFNGLMEPAFAWPNYLNRERYDELVANGMAGPALAPTLRLLRDPETIQDMLPKRPGWLDDGDIVFRQEIFAKLKGLLTYGSPLNKFAALWPARVPINNDENVFGRDIGGTEWINVYDKTDPVGAPLTAFEPNNHLPDALRPTNLGYAAGPPILLRTHISYLAIKDQKSDQLSDRVANWLIDGGDFRIDTGSPGWYTRGSPEATSRLAAAYVWWFLSYALLSAAGVFGLELIGWLLSAIAPSWLAALPAAVCSATWANVACGQLSAIAAWIDGASDHIAAVLLFFLWGSWKTATEPFTRDAIEVLLTASAITVLVGFLARLPVFFSRDGDDINSRANKQAPQGPPAQQAAE